MWILESASGSNTTIGEHMTYLLTLMEDRSDQLRNLADDCSIDIFIAFSSGKGQGGFVLDQAIIRRLGALPVDLVVNLYPPIDDDPTR